MNQLLVGFTKISFIADIFIFISVLKAISFTYIFSLSLNLVFYLFILFFTFVCGLPPAGFHDTTLPIGPCAPCFPSSPSLSSLSLGRGRVGKLCCKSGALRSNRLVLFTKDTSRLYIVSFLMPRILMSPYKAFIFLL